MAFLYDDKISNTIASARQKVGGFDVNSMGERVLWSVSDQNTYQDASSSIPAIAEGDGIYRWWDISGMHSDLIQATQSQKPTIKLNGLNGLSTVKFSAASIQFFRADFARHFDCESPTIYLVAKRTSGSSPFCGKGDATTAGTALSHRKLMMSISGTTQLRYYAGSDSMASCLVNATTANWNIYIIRGMWNRYTSLNVNGVETIKQSEAIVDNTTLHTGAFTVGCGFFSGAEPSDCEIAEIMVFDRILMPWEVTGLLTYASNKWGISVV